MVAISALKNKGLKLFAFTSNPNSINKIKELGVDDCILSPIITKEPIKELAQKVNLFDVVIDPFADINFEQIVPYLNYGAKYITCGVQYQADRYLPDLKFNYTTNKQSHSSDLFVSMIIKNISIIGNCLGQHEDLEKAIELVESGDLHIPIDSVFSKGKISEFLDRSFNFKEKFGKVVYLYDSEE